MSERLQGSLGRRWNPGRLGESLPIARGMRMSRLFGWALFGATLAAVAWRAGTIYSAEMAGLTDRDRQDVILNALANEEPRTRWLAWDPNVSLGDGSLPEPAPTPPAPLWTWADPGQDELASEPEAAQRAQRAYADGDYNTAVSIYEELADSLGLWKFSYNLGLSLQRIRLNQQAIDALKGARDLLERSGYVGSEEERLAAMVVTNYAMGEQRLLDSRSCLAACRDLKLALANLKRLAKIDRTLRVREIPFPIAPTHLNSYDVWLRLNEMYRSCDEYPEEYFSKGYGSDRYRSQDIAPPYLAQNRDGLFPKAARDCWERDGDREGRCWWLLNYSHLRYYSQDIVQEPSPYYRESWPALARLHQHLTVILAGDDNRLDDALKEFASAYRLLVAMGRSEPESSNGEADVTSLWSTLDEAGAYLAKSIEGDNDGLGWGVLAEPYRNKSITEIPFNGARGWQLKAMAQALNERWRAQVRSRRPDEMAQEIAAARNLIAPRYFEDLDSWWQGEVRSALHDRLRDAIRNERQRHPEQAKAIRDHRADYLGKWWRFKAALVWFEPYWLQLVGILMAGLLVVGLWWLIHRYVVYPYLLYSRNYYQLEFQRRHRERQKKGLPFIAPELEEERRRLRNAQRP